MELDDLKGAWAAHTATLERSLAIQQRLLRGSLLRRLRWALAPWMIGRALEAALGVAAIGAAVPVLLAHAGEPRYAILVGGLLVFAVILTALSTHLLVRTLALDWGRPVTAIQREVEQIRVTEYRALKWALLGGVVFWLPALLALVEVLTGVPALARVDLAWLIANVAFGLGLLALGQALSRRFVERPGLGAGAQRMMDALSGRGLRQAAARLAEVGRFEGEG
ncbi:MAG: hypothetical protein MUF27_17610 [Acidobacteria bacterium]|jgi:hypothetical protein|nr:hypothetical protein [Acidobacteriota bacterium]